MKLSYSADILFTHAGVTDVQRTCSGRAADVILDTEDANVALQTLLIIHVFVSSHGFVFVMRAYHLFETFFGDILKNNCPYCLEAYLS